jgi:hypothetical protein
MAKIKKYQRGGCLSTTGSGTRIKMYKQAAGEGSSDRMYRKEARQAARAERKEARVEKRAAKNAPEAKYGKKVKKAQSGATMDPRVAELLNKRKAADTTKMHSRAEMMQQMSDIATGRIKPRVDTPYVPPKSGQGLKKYAVINGNDTTYLKKEDFERRFGKNKNGGKTKKAKSGGSFPDLNKDGKITKADILKGRGVIKNGGSLKKAQKGASVKKAPAVAKYVSPFKSDKTADSTQYFTDKKADISRAKSSLWHNYTPITKDFRIDTARQNRMHREYDNETIKATNDLNRQRAKGKPGFDKNGNPITYKQATGSKKKAGGMVGKSKSVVKVIKKSIKKK